MGKRAQIIVDKALRLKEDDQSEPKRLKLNQCNEVGANIQNFENKKTNNQIIQVPNLEDPTITESSQNIIIKEILVFKSPIEKIQIPRLCSSGIHTDENKENELRNKHSPLNLKVIVEGVPIIDEFNEGIVISHPISPGTNIMNTEHKEPENLEFQCQNNEDLLEEIAIPDEDSLEEMVIDNNYNNYELNNIEQEIQNEDSDDSMKDRDYIPDSESVSSLEEGEVDLLFDEEEIERKQKLKQEKENWKGRSKKGRNNKYPGQTFATRKKLKDANKTHYTVKGKLKEAKQFIDYKCSCLKKCSEKLSGDEKGIYFKNFYDLASYDLQTSYIAATVKEMPIKRKRAKNGPG
ncbi:unnamed protein product [Phaedon cochleariae]|uniref:Uncharacterized protein n=1 Tax=Phaedon cochleariae TaxID=80249 RepID=A0A9N9WY71_PHACE|nr:unnamed protein product [Phaedon cochleariae]